MLTFFNEDVIVADSRDDEIKKLKDENKQLLKVLRKAYKAFSEECPDISIECVECPFRVRCQSENDHKEKWYEG